jgi:hypothetical protein
LFLTSRWTPPCRYERESFQEPGNHLIGRGPLGVRRCLRVEGQGEARVGVPETGLSGAHVNPRRDQLGGNGSAQVMEAGALEARFGDGSQPHPAPPVRGPEGPPLGAWNTSADSSAADAGGCRRGIASWSLTPSRL